MKNSILASLLMLLISCGNQSSTTQSEKSIDSDMQKPASEPIVEIESTPGSKLKLEMLKDSIDLSMDYEDLSLSDIRLLRNAFFARQGYCFMKSDLRGIFSTTSWYDKRMEERFWAFEEGNPMPEIKLTEEEQGFINKLLKRENELLEHNFINKSDKVYPNLNNLVNRFQMESMSEDLLKKLTQNGFAIVPDTEIQLFHVYEKNDYKQFPNFVTTDMYLQIMHMYFGYVLRTIENQSFIPLLNSITKNMMVKMQDFTNHSDESIGELAKFNFTFYAIAFSALNDTIIEVPKGYESYYTQELENIKLEQDAPSEFLDFKSVEFPYSLFKPRGHYTRNEELRQYFKAMMWLQTAPFCISNDDHLKNVLLSVDAMLTSSRKNNTVLKSYQSILEPINFLIGEPDNISFLQVKELLAKEDEDVIMLIEDPEKLDTFREKLKELAQSQNRIQPKQAVSCVDKINFMPQRYLADNEILQELVDIDSPESKRAFPKGLDVMAAFGSASAKDILLNEIEEDKRWEEYSSRLANLQLQMSEINWNSTVYNKWVESLINLQKPNVKYPYFMQSKAWAKKDLNASLASWAELKHDAILYAEQPMAAECGGGGPPDPYTVGYVEPNINYWKTVIEFLDLTLEVLNKNKLIIPDIERVSKRLRENAVFLLSASEKELNNERLNDQEYREIEYIGSTFEWITLDLIEEEGQYLDGWHNVQGPDRSVAVVADIYTSNALNNSNKGVLHVATGNVNDLYVVVEIEGYLYITRGAVLEYREFSLPLGNRLNDEQWQEMLNDNKAPAVPSWMKEIIVEGEKPEINQKIFYSSGC